jgi:hypothetical protein
MQLPTEIRQTINENLKTRDKNRESKTRDGKVKPETGKSAVNGGIDQRDWSSGGVGSRVWTSGESG